MTLFTWSHVLTAGPAQPNVVILVADDLGWGDVGYHGGEIQTPHIDQLVKDGMELNRWYSYPICSPTRAAMLTGHMAMRHGVFGPMPRKQTLTHEEKWMQEAFKDAGYTTMLAGKWHLGAAGEKDLPHQRGFDHTYGSLMAGPDYWEHGKRGRRDWYRDGKALKEEGYMTTLLGKEVSRLIRERDKNKPFFTYVAFTAPHAPLQAPKEVIEKYKHIQNVDRRTYCAMVEVLDFEIGRILKTIDEEGIRENTIVLFFSDNGASRVGDNGDFRGGKGSVYEGGVRMPAVVRWPGTIPAGVRCEQPMVVYDLFPTLAEATGISPKINTAFDGESLWDVWKSGTARARKTDIVIASGSAYAVLSGNYKLVHSGINKHTASAVEKRELFEIYKDPYEKVNLAEKLPKTVESLLKKHPQVRQWVEQAPVRQRRGKRK